MGHREGSILAELESILDRLRVLERDGAALAAADDSAAGAVLESIRRSCARLKKRLEIQRVQPDTSSGVADEEGSPALRRGLRSTWGRRSGSAARARNEESSSRASARAAFSDQLKAIKEEQHAQRRDRVAWALGVLGAKPGSSMDDLRACYRALIRRVHPDAAGAQGPAASLPTFADVQQAWEILQQAEAWIGKGSSEATL